MEAALRDIRSVGSAPLPPDNAIDWPAVSPLPNYLTEEQAESALEPPSERYQAPIDLEHDHLTATVERTRRVAENKPPIDLVISLSSLFFRHVHPWFPFLDPRRVMGELGTVDEGSLLHHALFGVSLPFSYDSRLDKLSSDSFWKFSKRQIMIEALEEPSYNSLEALVVLILDLSGMTNGAQVWGALAIATRLAIQLKPSGPNSLRNSVENNSRPGVNPQDQLCKHRLFWAIYALDCFISITTCNRTELRDEYVEHFIPDRDLVWEELTQSSTWRTRREGASQGEDNLAPVSLNPQYVFKYFLQLLDISRKAHSVFLNFVSLGQSNVAGHWMGEFLACSNELLNWPSTLPHSLQLDALDTTSRTFPNCLPLLLTLHGYWCALVISLQSLLSCSTIPEHIQAGENQSLAHEHCMQAVSRLMEVLRHFDSRTSKQVGWPFAWCLWVALRYVIIRNYRYAMPIPQAWDFLLACLRALGKYWQIAAKYARMIDQTTAELRLGPENSLHSVTRFLPAFADIRISTADLDDRFRVDPVLHSREAERLPPSSVVGSGNYQHVNRHALPREMNMGGEGGSTDMSIFQNVENWYAMPLFATSAYQQNL